MKGIAGLRMKRRKWQIYKNRYQSRGPHSGQIRSNGTADSQLWLFPDYKEDEQLKLGLGFVLPQLSDVILHAIPYLRLYIDHLMLSRDGPPG